MFAVYTVLKHNHSKLHRRGVAKSSVEQIDIVFPKPSLIGIDEALHSKQLWNVRFFVWLFPVRCNILNLGRDFVE